ncbi:Uncharacterised protein [Streptococcus constellatus]|uniref:Replicative helicase loading/DNA remodeling protein DnaB N-terminal winged helix domain-containing protein n=1 Tax=Streptococcus constellatus TaxID=76860 RepID=A0A564U1C6_STRCV|nr:DNA helicase [Streptococcus constellatus]VUW98860.1 Uncharacterised protein [Streptococcus gordonii]VUX13299.1 Uncharacterised protein [Streptococcus constellatus]
MKPNDQFSFMKNNLISQDSTNLIRLYLPILGLDATSIYQYFLAFWDNEKSSYTFGHILNHLNLGMNALQKSLEMLSAMQLVELYYAENHFQVYLRPTLSPSEFLSNPVYRRLLEKKIGEAAVEVLLPSQPRGEKQNVKLSEIFQVEDAKAEPQSKQNHFELDYFKQLMARENLRFENEKEDLLVLFAIAEQKNWTWYETYLLAKETAVGHVISTKRMKQKLNQKPAASGFSNAEQTIIREAKSKSALQFLAEIKKTKHATITRGERQCLQELANLGLLDEVINVILLLTFNKVDSANLNEKYALKVANDFSYQEVTSAEEAVLRIRERNQQPSKKANQTTTSKSNVPDWSNPDYKNETSAEKQAELEEQKRKLLAKLDQGGD